MDGKKYGFYRAEVLDSKDPEKYGRVLVWIPVLMEGIGASKNNTNIDNLSFQFLKQSGIWARPANNPIGGRNTESGSGSFYAGSSYIPLKGSWVWVFFEDGNPNRPYYFGALDIENTTVLPENKLGKNYENKWTIFKSHAGRTVIISDDPDDERVEITGKKRLLTSPPSGDEASVYQIDKNQTTILLDERKGKEKLLIRSYKGDFIHFDIDQQELQMSIKNDIKIKTEGNFFLDAGKNINILGRKSIKIKSNADLQISSKTLFNISTPGIMNIFSSKTLNITSLNMDIFSNARLSLTSNTETNIYSTGITKMTSMGALHLKSMGNVAIDGTTLFTQMGIAIPAVPGIMGASALSPIIIPPKGSRDT